MLKPLLHKTALHAERFASRWTDRTGTGRAIDPNIGYATPDNIVLRGRVLSALRHSAAQPGQSKLANLRQIAGMFLTDEVRDATVQSEGVSTKTDEEGYFTLLLPRDGQSGWSTRDVTVDDEDNSVACPVLIPADNARFMVISDIDDTMLETGAYSLAKNLYTSFTGNAGSRRVFPDSIDLMQSLSDVGRNPVYYVSSSPWNLHDFLADIFERTGLVRGPMFLRDLGLSATKFVTEGHGNHKGGSIDTLLAANPDLPAILLGDTGQHDAHIYRKVIERHPGRILAVGLRTPGAGIDVNDAKDIAALKTSDVPTFAARDFTEFGKFVATAHPQHFDKADT
ncbi:MAG: phosphatase domain-containing protein [Sulfitobacter sp.]